MATHSLGHNPLLPDTAGLSDDLSFDFLPPKPGHGALGADPGLWLADHDSLPIGGDLSENISEWLYYLGQSKPISLLPHFDDNSSNAASSGGAAPTTVALVEDYGSGFPHAGPPGIDLFAKPGGGSGSGGGHGGGKGGGGGGGVPTPYSVTINGIHFVADWDSSVGSAPSGFVSGFETAVNNVLNTLSGPIGGSSITITMNVGWGEVGGQSLSRGALGQSSTWIEQRDYATLQHAMGDLPPDATAGSGTFWVATAEEKALGLGVQQTSLTNDGSVGFGSNYSWNFAGSPGSTQYDFIGVAEHEITEVMGRIALLGGTVGGVSNSYTPYDLFRYTSQGTQSLTAGADAYFSFDSGVSSDGSGDPNHRTYFNTQAGGDYGDWQSSGANSAGIDAYDAFAKTGTVYLSPVDQQVMHALGYRSPISA
jgi:hypothetical protein